MHASGLRVSRGCVLQTFMLFLAHAYGGLQRHRVATRDIPAPSLPVHNARRYGELTVDGPLYLLWPCLIPWLLFEANMGYAWLHHLPGLHIFRSRSRSIALQCKDRLWEVCNAGCNHMLVYLCTHTSVLPWLTMSQTQPNMSVCHFSLPLRCSLSVHLVTPFCIAACDCGP